MRFIALSTVCLAVLLGGSTAVWAQSRPSGTGQPQQRPATGAPQTPATPLAAAPAPAGASNAPVAPQVAGEAAAVSGWNTRCISPGRRVAQECYADQALTLSRNGQLMMQFALHFPAEGQPMTLTLQLPVGILLPAGAKLRLDNGNPFDLTIRTCEQRGCFVTAPVLPDFVNALRTARRIDVGVQNTNGETVVLTMPLEGFVAAHDKVK